ncbi:ROK family protein [Sphingomonas koreensis]|nr:ROK family protein [Sphingomonas koreensis]
MNDLVAGIEAGGTKMLCAIAAGDGRVVTQQRIATAAPDETFAAIADFYRRECDRHGRVTAGGVASFGPLDLDRDSPHHGSLAATPKPGWSSIDIRGRIAAILDAPTVIDTDVNCAALAELKYGAGQRLDRLCYVTVGTGIGMGWIEGGQLTLGMGHPEAGHIRVPRAPGDEGFSGICPYHGDCLEGLACGPAMAARWGTDAEALNDDHAGWRHQAHYIACLCIELMYTMRPQRIILGGGVMSRSSLYDRVRNRFAALANGYALDRWSIDPAAFICAPALSDPSPGLVGAIELARARATGAHAA